MADKMAMKMGQRFLKKKLASKQGEHGKQGKQANQSQSDNDSLLHYKLKDDQGKTKRMKKDVAYYTAQGVSPKEAEILLKVLSRARKLDSGFKFLGLRIGWSSIIGFVFPVAGDCADVALSWLLVIRKAEQVSGGDDKRKLRRHMYMYLVLSFGIGFTPGLGEIVDTLLRYNTKSAEALETMLLKRGAKALALAADAEKADVGMETAAPVAARNHAAANTPHKAQPVHRAPVRQKSESARKVLTTDDEQYGDMHKRIATKSAKGPANKSQKTKSGGTWFGKRGAQTSHVQNGRTGGGPVEVAPVPPPRPAVSGRGDGWF